MNGPGEEVALELAHAGLHRGQGRDSVGQPAPAIWRQSVQAAVDALGQVEAVGQLLAKTSRDGQPVLLVDGVNVLAEEHRSRPTWAGPTYPHGLPLFPTFFHSPPPAPIVMPNAAPGNTSCEFRVASREWQSSGLTPPARPAAAPDRWTFQLATRDS